MHGGGRHHLDLRQRASRTLAPYPHPDALKRGLDRVMMVVAIAGPLATLPQVYQVYATKDAIGLSPITWGLWTLLSMLWCFYGYVHKEWPIMVSNVIYIILQGAIVTAIVLYS